MLFVRPLLAVINRSKILNLKANHNIIGFDLFGVHAVINRSKILNLKANHNSPLLFAMSFLLLSIVQRY